MHQPPAGFEDMLTDAKEAEHRLPWTAPYVELEVPEVGTVMARRPLPRSVPALAMSANSKIALSAKVDYLTLFVQNHVGPGVFEDLLVGTMLEKYPANAVQLVARAIATWGTPRPTQPSSASR